jgi:hypothetical protein
MPEVDYVFRLSTPGRGTHEQAAIEDVLSDALQEIAERLDGFRFDLELVKVPAPTLAEK